MSSLLRPCSEIVGGSPWIPMQGIGGRRGRSESSRVSIAGGRIWTISHVPCEPEQMSAEAVDAEVVQCRHLSWSPLGTSSVDAQLEKLEKRMHRRSARSHYRRVVVASWKADPLELDKSWVNAELLQCCHRMLRWNLFYPIRKFPTVWLNS